MSNFSDLFGMQPLRNGAGSRFQRSLLIAAVSFVAAIASFVSLPNKLRAEDYWDTIQITCSSELESFSVRTKEFPVRLENVVGDGVREGIEAKYGVYGVH